MVIIRRHAPALGALLFLNLVIFAPLIFLTREGVPHATIPFDFASQYSIWLVYISDCFREGIFPLWSPYVGAGTPFFINPQSQLYTPLTLLIAPTLGYTQRAAQLQSVFMLFFGGVGAYALSCRLWSSRWAGMVTGVCYNFTSAVFANLEHTTIITAAALIPWLLWATTLAARERRPWAFPLLAFFVYFLLTGGYPGVILMTLLWLFAYTAYLIVRSPLPARDRLRLAARHGLAWLVGIGLAGAHWLPIAIHRREFTRGAAPLSINTALLGGNLFFKHLWGMFFQFMTENPLPGTEPDISMRGVYFGALAIPLAVAALLLIRDEIVPVFLALSVGAFLMACGGVFFARVFLHIVLPLFNMSRFPSADSRSLMVLSLAVLAGGGAALLRAGDAEARGVFSRGCVGLVAVLLLGLFGLRAVLPPQVFNDIAVNYVTAELFFVALAMLALRVFTGRALMVCLVALLAFELGTCVLANMKIVGAPVTSSQAYLERRARHRREFTPESAAAPRRALGGDELVSEESNEGYLEKSFYLSEYNPFRLTRFENLIRNGFTEWMTSGPRVVALPPDARPGDYESFRQHATPVEHTILAYTPNRVAYRVRADGDAVLVFNEVNFPGWRAQVDGTRAPLGEVGGGLRAMRVTAGEHTIEMTFRPRSFYAGLALSLVSALLFVVWSFFALRRTRRPAPATSEGPA
jgi:hypothetical protein